jgi:anhydro-N-acetylmuramic acid kinase
VKPESAALYVGLMSGTSLDAIDAALVEFSATHSPRLLQTHSLAIPDALRHRIEMLCQPDADEISRMGALDVELGDLFAEAALAVIKKNNTAPDQITAIGSHGQTVRHHPFGSAPFSLQIGDPNTIAFRTSITTIADFRRMDMAAGGQGAPLVPAFHDAILRDDHENRVIVNIGGMANITVLCSTLPVSGFDTGPGNVLMNAWIQKKLQQPYDDAGQWARTGRCDDVLLHQLMSHPYIIQAAPKSTGRETFHLTWLESQLPTDRNIPAENIQRTLLEFTARSICTAISHLPEKIDRVLLCGGGSHNVLLRERIAALLPKSHVGSTSDFGVSADWLEAMAFAWLAKQRLENKPSNVPAATGAKQLCILGGVYQPPVS